MRTKQLLALLVIVVMGSCAAHADSLSLNLMTLSINTDPGSTATFKGMITNNTGADLSSTDLFFNFFNFDPVRISPVQLLGSSSFTISNGTTSSMVDLFSVTVDPGAPLNSAFSMSLTLAAINDDISAELSVVLTTNQSGGGGDGGGGGNGGGTTPVPEPGGLSFIAVGMLVLLGRWRRRLIASFCFVVVLGLAATATATSPSPAFSTKAPSTGKLGNDFVVFLPVFNTGTADANTLQVSSVRLGQASPQTPSLPLAIGTLAAGDHAMLELQFDSSSLMVGSNYLLTVRGTYQSGTQIYGFSLNRFITVNNPTQAQATQLHHWIALDAVQQEFASLSGIDAANTNQTLLDFLRSRPEFIASGIDDASSTVWAVFENGEEIGIINNRKLDSVPAAAPTENPIPGNLQDSSTSAIKSASLKMTASPLDPSRSGPNLPESTAAHLMTSIPLFGAPIPSISQMLDKQHYQHTPVSASLETLMSGFSANDGIFYFSTHGGYVGQAGSGEGPLRYVLWSSTKADIASENALPLSDILGTPDSLPTIIRTLAASSVDPATGEEHREWHFGITAAFVRKYFGKFSDASLVFIDACSSADERSGPDSAQDMKQAFFDKNASSFIGWTVPTLNSQASDTALLIFDRLLGSNTYFREQEFDQRPFGLFDIQTDLPQHVHGDSSVTFSSNPRAASPFLILAPSLANMLVEETKGDFGQLTINGIFGRDQGTVSLNGTDATISSWDSDKVVVDLPTNFEAGDVIVKVRTHESNKGRITGWHGTGFKYTYTEGALNAETTFDVRFRADIRKYREAIHEPPKEPTGLIAAMMGSSADVTCDGSVKRDDVTYKLEGHANYPAFFLQNGNGRNIFTLTGNFDNSHTQISFALGTTGLSGCTCTVCDPDRCTTSPFFIFGPSNAPVRGTPFTYLFSLDDTSARISDGPEDSKFPPATCLPDGTGQGLFSWNGFDANMPPDPKSAR